MRSDIFDCPNEAYVLVHAGFEIYLDATRSVENGLHGRHLRRIEFEIGNVKFGHFKQSVVSSVELSRTRLPKTHGAESNTISFGELHIETERSESPIIGDAGYLNSQEFSHHFSVLLLALDKPTEFQRIIWNKLGLFKYISTPAHWLAMFYFSCDDAGAADEIRNAYVQKFPTRYGVDKVKILTDSELNTLAKLALKQA